METGEETKRRLWQRSKKCCMILKSGSDTPYTGRQCVSRTKHLNFYFHLGVLLLFNKGPFKVCLTCSLNLQLLCMVTPEKDRLLHWDIANLPIFSNY